MGKPEQQNTQVPTATIKDVIDKLNETQYLTEEQFKAMAGLIADEERRMINKSWQLMFEDVAKRAALTINIQSLIQHVWRGLLVALIIGIATGILIVKVIWI